MGPVLLGPGEPSNGHGIYLAQNSIPPFVECRCAKAHYQR